MDTQIEVGRTPTGATVEVGSISLNGRTYSALGSVVDEEAGLLVGYVSVVGCPPHYVLTEWSGKFIAPLTKVSSWIQRTHLAQGEPSVGMRMFAWRATYHGRTYSGRNGGWVTGPEGLLRLHSKP